VKPDLKEKSQALNSICSNHMDLWFEFTWKKILQ